MMVHNKFPPLLKLLAVPAEKRNAFWKMACVDVNCFGLSNKFPSSVPTGDGRNPAYQLIWRIYHYLHAFFTSQVVVWDFWTINSTSNDVCKATSTSLLHHFHPALTGLELFFKRFLVKNLLCKKSGSIFQSTDVVNNCCRGL